ncbi:MAG: hypothetical protein Q4G59_07610, partial [Planctomycetia bacterium]|nr:hypothetical protein [Planctomycetia bacterium]
MGSGSYLTYRFTAPGKELFYGGTIEVNLAYYTSGEFLVELSNDGKTWNKIGGVAQSTGSTVTLPALKTPVVWVGVGPGEKSG